jgi:hypothetical protein
MTERNCSLRFCKGAVAFGQAILSLLQNLLHSSPYSVNLPRVGVASTFRLLQQNRHTNT